MKLKISFMRKRRFSQDEVNLKYESQEDQSISLIKPSHNSLLNQSINSQQNKMRTNKLKKLLAENVKAQN